MARDWCFTCFDTDNELSFEKDNVRYICYGRERCPTTNREHYQGFAIFKRTCRIPKAKKWIGGGDGTHLEPRRGTRNEARDYCGKSEGEFIEWGLFDGMTKEDLFKQPIDYLKEEYPEFYCRYHRGLEKLQIKKSPKWREVEVIWLWGEGGTGKTRRAMEEESVYKLDRPYEWFCGYEQEEVLVLDDVSMNDFREKRGLFLNLLDGHSLRLPIKGGHTYAHWRKLYLTSNWNPIRFMEDKKEWDRRITKVIEM